MNNFTVEETEPSLLMGASLTSKFIHVLNRGPSDVRNLLDEH